MAGFACLVAQCSNAAHAQPPPTPAGEWRTIGDDGTTPRAVIRITESGGEFTGRIVRSLVPGEDPDKLCAKCPDARKDQRLRGMAFLTGMKKTGDAEGEYGGGEILDPDSGGIYRSRMTLTADGRRLIVRGYIGIPLFGRTQEWIRAD